MIIVSKLKKFTEVDLIKLPLRENLCNNNANYKSRKYNDKNCAANILLAITLMEIDVVNFKNPKNNILLIHFYRDDFTRWTTVYLVLYVCTTKFKKYDVHLFHVWINTMANQTGVILWV